VTRDVVWKGDRMGFFDTLPPSPEREPEPPQPAPPPWMKPETELSAAIGERLVLAHTDEAAVAVNQLRAYSTGFEFTMSAVLRQENRSVGRFEQMRHRWDEEEPISPHFLRVGVRFANGDVVSNLRRPGRWRDGPAPDGPVLMGGGGSGDRHRYDSEFWVWPLPPAGPVTFVCEWPAFDIAESVGQLDGQVILDAAARAVRLWPADRVSPEQPARAD
jgi:hypothetical protein